MPDVYWLAIILWIALAVAWFGNAWAERADRWRAEDDERREAREARRG